jgi:hypothetical protein
MKFEEVEIGVGRLEMMASEMLYDLATLADKTIQAGQQLGSMTDALARRRWSQQKGIK